MATNETIETLRNSTVFGPEGEKIGKVGELYLDAQTGNPTFVTVNTGLFGTNESFVPVDQAALQRRRNPRSLHEGIRKGRPQHC